MIDPHKRNQKRLQKLRKRHKEKKKKIAILRVMRDHNEVKYRKIPGQPGTWPYQQTPITFDEARVLYETGNLPVRKEVNHMSDVVVHEQVQVVINGVTYNLVPVDNATAAPTDPNANAGQNAPTDPSAGQATDTGATPTDPNAPADPASGNGEANPGEQPAA